MVEDGDEPEERPSLRSSLLRFALALAGVAAIGLVAGIVYGRATPERAAGTLVDAVVVQEDFQGDERVAATTSDPAPTSGDHVGEPTCGVSGDPVDADTQLASLAAGRIVLQYDPDALTDEERRDLATWVAGARSDDVLLAPNRDLLAPVMATAWTRRLPLRAPEYAFLSSFVTAYAGSGPRPEPCDGGAEDAG